MPPITENTPVRFSDPLPDAVDFVVIGAGVVGFIGAAIILFGPRGA